MSIHSAADITELLQELTRAAALWIPEVQVVLELYIPEEIKQHVSVRTKLVSDESADEAKNVLSERNLSSYAARYADARNNVNRALADGFIFGGLESPESYSIPEDILRERLQVHLDIKQCPPSAWTTLPIFGAPGSGKTEIGSLIAKQLAVFQKAIVLICSTPSLLADVESLRKTNREEGFFSLAKDTCLNSGLLPTKFRDDESVEALIDSLYELLCSGASRQPVVLVVDDLHARREIRESLSHVRSEAKDWGLHFILISRTRIEIFEQENNIELKVHCEPWSRREAEQILKSWVEKDRKQDIATAINEGWLASRAHFSVYLLRIIAENIDDLGQARDKPSTLLTKAINRHLSDLNLEIKSKQSPADLLVRIQTLLERGESPDRILQEMNQTTTIDYVTLLGILSWMSHFEHQDNVLSAFKIRDWSKGFIGTEEEAKRFLDAGSKVGVFTDLRGGKMWHDKLIADGCAALYLGSQVESESLSDQLISEMLDQLDSAESIDILTLALDTPVLLRLIEAVANVKPSLASVIPKLITSDFILQLRRSPEWLHGMWAHLWKYGSRVQVAQMKPFSVVLQKLMTLDPSLEIKCQTMIKEGSEGLLALTIEAAQFPDTSRFFEEVEKYSPPYLLPMAAEVAARFCDADGWRVLTEKLTVLEETGLQESELKRIWGLYCKGQGIPYLFEVIERLLAEINQRGSSAKAEGRFADFCLEGMVNRPPSEVSSYGAEIEHLLTQIKELAKNGNPLGGKLVKWVALFYASEIVDKDGNWLIDRTATFAIPKSAYNALTVKQIFGRISSAYPRFQLASASEIRGLPMSGDEIPELVRDYLPRGFSYNEKFQPSNCAVWNGKLSYVTHDKIDSTRLAWRPRLSL